MYIEVITVGMSFQNGLCHCNDGQQGRIQAEIVGHGDLYLCAVFLTVHDKLTCEGFITLEM
jgi:hypothetical protein